MNFLRRNLICDRLRLEVRQSYRIVGSSRSGLISSDEVLRILNRSRHGIPAPFAFIPTDIMRPDELSEYTGLPENKIRAWTRRTKNVPPHFRLNGHTIRYPHALFVAWLANNSKVERCS